MAEHVSPLDLAVTRDPNAPEAVLIGNDPGATGLAVRPHSGDKDQRCVVLAWHGTESASMAAPSDETISGHRLYDKGLRDLSWAGVVQNSELADDLERQNQVHPAQDASKYKRLTHPIVPLKEDVVEVVARALTIEHHDGPTLTAAVAALDR